jgi:hypothetical protein
MPVIAVEVAEALANTAAVLGIVNGLQSQIATAQQTAILQDIQTRVDLLYSIATDPTIGNSAIIDKINTLTALLSDDVTAILTAIGSPTQTGVPVDVSSGSQSAIQSGVWAESISDSPEYLAGDILAALGTDAYYKAQLSPISVSYRPWFWLFPGTYPVTYDFVHNIDVPNCDPSTILAGDSMFTWLTRENPTFTVSLETDGEHVILQGPDEPVAIWSFLLDDAQFAALKSGIFPVASAAPIWPGIDKVTLGSATPFSGDVTVAGPMDGVLVNILTAPSKQGQFDFDGDVSYRNAGGLAFQSDNGDDEFPQLLGFVNAIYCPRSMTQAASVKVRVTPGVTGTVTPWTVS